MKKEKEKRRKERKRRNIFEVLIDANASYPPYPLPERTWLNMSMFSDVLWSWSSCTEQNKSDNFSALKTGS